MTKARAKPELHELRAAYATAVMAFDSASAVLILHFAAGTLPTNEQVATEEASRAAVIATGRQFRAAMGGTPAGFTVEPRLPPKEANRGVLTCDTY